MSERILMADLDTLLETAKIDADVRALVIGRAGQAAKNQIDLALENHRGRASPPTTTRRKATNSPAIHSCSICRRYRHLLVTLALSRIPDAFEELLHDILKDAMRPGGVVALQFWRDASDAAFDRLKTHANVRVILHDFLKHQFGAEIVGADRIAEKFARDGAFEFLEWHRARTVRRRRSRSSGSCFAVARATERVYSRARCAWTVFRKTICRA